MYAEEARASGKPDDDVRRRGIRERFAQHDPRASRLWELAAVMNGRPPMVGRVEDWRFIADAAKVRLA